jgi:hypothetical protein
LPAECIAFDARFPLVVDADAQQSRHVREAFARFAVVSPLTLQAGFDLQAPGADDTAAVGNAGAVGVDVVGKGRSGRCQARQQQEAATHHADTGSLSSILSSVTGYSRTRTPVAL